MAEKYKNAIRPHQGFQEKFVRSNVDVVFGGGQLAGGKENPVYTRILTRNGWVQMGDLSVGDFVCTPFGGEAKVLQIFEHKHKDIYEIETLDGRQARCGMEHLWSIRTEKQKAKYNKDRDFTKHITTCMTSDLIDMLSKGKKIYLPTPFAQEFSHKDYVIPPYILGVMIGDGCLTDSSWINDTHFVISNSEYDIIQRVSKMSGATRIRRDSENYSNYIFSPVAKDYKRYIEETGLNTYSYEKFIPKEYLWGSIEQRKQLLFGLMDTDGCVEEKNSFSFSTTSARLKNDFIYLCRSLGYIATYGVDGRSEKYTNGVCYDIIVHTDDVIFSSKKHLNRYYKNLELYPRIYTRTNDHVQITSIKKVDECDARCIYIDDPMHLYIIDDFVTTHNTFGSILSVAEPSLDPKFRAVFLRNNLGDLRASGGILDDFKNCYGMGVRVVESGEPHADFPCGSRVDITHVADQSKKVLEKRFKGRQYDLIYFDEMTGFTWECFSFMFSRNRGKARWTGKVRGTTNPKRSHWLRKFLDWYIGIDGEVIEEREGVVRYFYNAGETVEEVVWGDSKEEVYNKCKIQIDRFLRKFNGKRGHATYKDVIKSFTFYLGRTSENEELGAQYASSVAAMGGRNAEENSGNWNVDTDADEDAAIPSDMANKVFTNDKCVNGDRWVTCDLADTGTDNLLMLAWDGLHIYDCKIKGHTSPRENAYTLQEFAAQHDVADDHIIYDAIRGTYINDYIPDAEQFVSYRAPRGLFGRGAQRLKDECYMRVVEAIKRGYLSMEEEVALRIYEHQKLKGKERVTIQNEFLEECAVVRFMDMPSGKKRLYSKKEMNLKLGKGRSMDLLDPIAMRMLPLLDFPYGEELEKTAALPDEDDDELDEYDSGSVFSDTLFS